MILSKQLSKLATGRFWRGSDMICYGFLEIVSDGKELISIIKRYVYRRKKHREFLGKNR